MVEGVFPGRQATSGREASDELEGVVKGADDVIDVLESDGEADEFGLESGLALILVGELGVGGGGGVDDEALGVADVGEEAEELDVVDESDTLGAAALDAEDDHAAGAVGEVLLGEGVGGVGGESGIADPGDLRMVAEILGDLEGVGAVALHAEGKGLDALEEDPGGVG